MSWSEYLALRKGRLLWQRIATVPGAIIGLFGGASYFASLEMDPAKPIMGLDPFMFYGGCTAGCMALGGVLGPSMGSALWRLKSRSVVRSFDARDANFFRRIEKYRADASLASNSTTGQMPDYYGEKIGSLHQYRTWLRDQGKFKRRHEFTD
ncbi:mitochondrial import protein Pam17 [Cylindrobasidium torrendii FP15055 ss-10]|uniref:Presequence translocated-associated motor subunit PAM17 n=1 Tax=Cylindrobasidium torrendii FP15055 ss-10 TaxID=1314674 RepID=A0A0D7AW49_9AGAR|nr:mitochondrial import protein Pam17 [Cylindrobasidium torrendii FP15055 ss-10]